MNMLTYLFSMCKQGILMYVNIAISTLFIFLIIRSLLKCLHIWPQSHAPHKRKCRSTDTLYVVLLHPDLTIGGAERLMIDAALGLEQHQSDMKVHCHFITTHHNINRAFPETVNGSLHVTVYGDWLPLSIAQRGKVFCNTLRMMYAALVTCVMTSHVDCFIVDQVAMAMPLLKLCRPRTPIMFYCHFPDLRCDANRNDDGTFILPDSLSWKRRLLWICHVVYRATFDKLEAFAMSFANCILSNSHFSQGVMISAFPWLAHSSTITCDVLYPPVPEQSYLLSQNKTSTSSTLATELSQVETITDENNNNDKSKLCNGSSETKLRDWMSKHIVFVSINRYERKKSIDHAILAFNILMKKAVELQLPLYHKLRLVIAGGYNPELAENVEYAAELQHMADNMKWVTSAMTMPSDSQAAADAAATNDICTRDAVHEYIRFMYNVTNEEKYILLQHARALIYTAANEHFGIVPVEAMQMGTAVIAVNHGGPCESVGTLSMCEGESHNSMITNGNNNFDDNDDNNTEKSLSTNSATVAEREGAGGILSPANANGFADAMMKLALDDRLAAQLGKNGKLRAKKIFAINAFSKKLINHIMILCDVNEQCENTVNDKV